MPTMVPKSLVCPHCNVKRFNESQMRSHIEFNHKDVEETVADGYMEPQVILQELDNKEVVVTPEIRDHAQSAPGGTVPTESEKCPPGDTPKETSEDGPKNVEPAEVKVDAGAGEPVEVLAADIKTEKGDDPANGAQSAELVENAAQEVPKEKANKQPSPPLPAQEVPIPDPAFPPTQKKPALKRPTTTTTTPSTKLAPTVPSSTPRIVRFAAETTGNVSHSAKVPRERNRASILPRRMHLQKSFSTAGIATSTPPRAVHRVVVTPPTKSAIRKMKALPVQTAARIKKAEDEGSESIHLTESDFVKKEEDVSVVGVVKRPRIVKKAAAAVIVTTQEVVKKAVPANRRTTAQVRR